MSDIQDIEKLVEELERAVRDEETAVSGTRLLAAKYLKEDRAALMSAISRVVQERDRYEKALTAIMHARRNPGVALTDMSRAGMREIAGAVLAEVGQMEGK